MTEQESRAAAPAKKRKPRLPAIEYIRGIAMMGVIAIHVGSQYLMNQTANIHLIALLEVASRFSVPIFFFISAFGLFYNLNIDEPLDYRAFMKKRFRTVLVPYLVWSAFYLLHDGLFYGVGFPDPLHLLSILFFGTAKYQLYFLVILIWFYLLMPLWIAIVRRAGKASLILLFVAQLGFDYWSSFSVAFNTFVYALPDHSFLKPFLMYRLNYWVVHYVFIFVLGGYLAVHIKGFQRFMQENRRAITVFFWASLIWLLAYYYQLIVETGYTPLEAVAFRVPCITTSLSGFGVWTCNSLGRDSLLEDGVEVIARNDYNAQEVAEKLSAAIVRYAAFDKKATDKARRNAGKLSEKALWKNFIEYYYEAYDFALQKASERR